MSSSNISQIVLAIFVIAIFSGAVYFQFFAQPKPEPAVTYRDYGPLPDFTLPSIDGTNFTLSNTTGKIRLVTFIYTACQHGCPLISKNMADLMTAVENAGLKNDVHFVTIDFDWQYDNLTHLATYAQTYRQTGDPWDFLMGNQNQTETVTNDWNFFYNLTSSPDNPSPTMGTMVEYDHIFIVYVLDQLGHWRHNLLGTSWTTSQGMQVINYLHKENITSTTTT